VYAETDDARATVTRDGSSCSSRRSAARVTEAEGLRAVGVESRGVEQSIDALRIELADLVRSNSLIAARGSIRSLRRKRCRRRVAHGGRCGASLAGRIRPPPALAPSRAVHRRLRPQLAATFIYAGVIFVTTWVVAGLSSSQRDSLLRTQSTNLDNLHRHPVDVLFRSAFWSGTTVFLPLLLLLAAVVAPAEAWLGTFRSILIFAARPRRGDAADGGRDQPRLLLVAGRKYQRSDRRRRQLRRRMHCRRADVSAAEALTRAVCDGAHLRVRSPRVRAEPELHGVRPLRECADRIGGISVRAGAHGRRASPPAAVPALAHGSRLTLRYARRSRHRR